ncbi:four helix bundle protein, partial [bacterium (Candidatus Howlettbacteria) CG_4_10_14_0_8_um_filter_40_9]
MKNDSNNRKYDLKKRTSCFGEGVIKFAKKLPKNVITLPIIGQLIKSSTSIGANYR